MANYEVNTTSNDVKVRNPQEVETVLTLMGLEESYASETDGTVWAGSYENSFDEGATIVRDKETHEILGVIKSWQDGLESYVEEELYEGCDNYAKLFGRNIDEFDTQDIISYLQEQMLDGEHFEFSMTGNEKLRCVDGWAVLITKNTVDYFNLDTLIGNKLEELELQRY